ncbi:hypothetical protein TNCV_3057961 [Trichonephila clavipes]|nr:hypothetical protein TNCV_3057961 [Trichonephila clavipes]
MNSGRDFSDWSKYADDAGLHHPVLKALPPSVLWELRAQEPPSGKETWRQNYLRQLVSPIWCRTKKVMPDPGECIRSAKILQFKVTGIRKRGRPRLRWTDSVKLDFRIMNEKLGEPKNHRQGCSVGSTVIVQKNELGSNRGLFVKALFMPSDQ